MKTKFTSKEKIGTLLFIIGTWSMLCFKAPAAFGDTIASNIYVWIWLCIIFSTGAWRIDGTSSIINDNALCPKGKIAMEIITSLIASFIVSIILMLMICVPHDLILVLFNPLNMIYKKKLLHFLFYSCFMHLIIGTIIYCRDN